MSNGNQPNGTAITHNTYDLRGRKLAASDPDMGLWSYSYDAFGALYQQTDAKAQTTTMGYDPLGRLLSRTEPDMSSNWTYGTSAALRNIDKLITAACTGAACASGGYSRAYLYDTYGRPSKLTITIGSSSYYTTTAYDLVTGQKSAVRAFSGFSLDYLYTARGYLSSIVDAVTAQPYWAANARDAELHATQTTFGNGVVTNEGYDPLTGRVLAISAGSNQSIANFSYQWDQVGNLLTRTDMLAISGGETEVSCYDSLNRLTNADLSNGASCTGSGTTTMTYNTDGGIRSKTGIGTYAYGAGAGPHALTSITGTVNGVVNPTFTYDANGNMLSGAGRTVSYTASNMISSISEGSSNTNVTLTYDSEHQRIQQGVSINGGAATTTTYLNDPAAGVMVESQHIPGVSNSWKTYIVADGKIVGQRVTINGQSAVDMKYFVLDHLGSVAVITDGNQYLADGVTPNPAYGTAIQRSFYDSWGKERNADGTPDTTCSLPGQSKSTRGFTNQEEMPSVCLINYNARIYDPAIGKFMTPDDLIPDVYKGSDYNRYTYVDDNPLSYDDPTGHECGNDCHSGDLNHEHGPSQNFCPGCKMDYDTTDVDQDVISHTPSTGTTDTGTSQSPSGLPQNGAVTPSSTSNTNATGPDGSDNSPGMSSPITDNPQAQQAREIDKSNAGSGYEGFDTNDATGDARGQRIAGGTEDEENSRRGGLIDPDATADVRTQMFYANRQDILRLDPANGFRDILSAPDTPPSSETVNASTAELEAVRSRVAENIANGHAFEKHAREFGNISREEFEEIVRDTISNPRARILDLSSYRTAYYNSSTNTLVIVTPGARDAGTMFRPEDRLDYVNRLR